MVNRGPIVLTIEEADYLLDQLPPPPAAADMRRRLTELLHSLRSSAPAQQPRRPTDAQGYAVPALTVDAAVLRGPRESLEILLVTRGREPFCGELAFPGGFVEYGESPEHAVLRELHEECGLRGLGVPKLVAVRGDPERDPRKHTCTVCYKVEVEPAAAVRGGDDAADARWYALDALLREDGAARMAFDHGKLLAQVAEFLDRETQR